MLTPGEALTVRVTFANGEQVSEQWTGRDRWKTYSYDRASRGVSDVHNSHCVTDSPIEDFEWIAKERNDSHAGPPLDARRPFRSGSRATTGRSAEDGAPARLGRLGGHIRSTRWRTCPMDGRAQRGH